MDFNKIKTLVLTQYGPGNHTPKVLELLARIPFEEVAGRITHIGIYHDDWCQLLKHQKPCDCDPDVGFI